MLIKAFFAGFGGQGVIRMGYTLAYAGMMEGRQVTCLPAYGAEVRGGTAHCTVAVSDDEIASPVASEPDFVTAMNTPSLIKFQNSIQSDGQLFLNSTLIKERPHRGDIEVIDIPATKMAEEIGSVRSTNMVMLGAFVKATRMVKLDSVLGAVEKIFEGKKASVIRLNKEALNKGAEHIIK